MTHKIATVLKQIFVGFVICGGVLSLAYLSLVRDRVEYSVRQQEISDSTMNVWVSQRDSLFRIVIGNQNQISANQDTIKVLLRANY